VHSALFKRGSHKGGDERVSLRRRCATAEELLERVEGLKYDYWEKGKALTAGCSRGQRTLRPDGDVRRFNKKALYVLGLSENGLARAVATLRESREAEELLRITRNRSIRFWPKSVGTPLRLYDEVAEQSETLLFTSLRQALGGGPRASSRWDGRSVMALADQIYRGHLNTHNRRVASRLRREGS
jgi:hypothetical protein